MLDVSVEEEVMRERNSSPDSSKVDGDISCKKKKTFEIERCLFEKRERLYDIGIDKTEFRPRYRCSYKQI